MKAQDLRIGNYVDAINKRHNEEFIEVQSITDECINVDFRPYEIKYLKPIPLTEEWLLKLGFVSNPYQDRYEKGDIDVECDKTKGETILWLAGAPHIKHVHQIQNLYFALTGCELEIN